MENEQSKEPDKSKKYMRAGMAGIFSVSGLVLIWQLILAFGRANIFGFGGGPAVIPLIRKEVVDNFNWLTIGEFTDTLAMGNALPGPIATKMAAYIGYKVAGIGGSLAALTATVLPTALAMVGLAGLYIKFKDTPQMAGMLKAVRPVVVILLLQTTIEMGMGSMRFPITWVIAAVAALLIFQFKIHPAILIVASMVFGYLFLAKTV